MKNRLSKNILIVITIFCGFLMVVSYLQSSVLEPVRYYAGYFLTPVQSGINRFGISVSNQIRVH